jgi:hypothetical protein
VVRASGNEVFALRHKTGTRQCLVVAAFGWRGHRRVVRSATCCGPGLGVGGHQLTEEGTEERSKHPATEATVLRRLLLSFSFFLEGCGDPLPLLPGRGPLVCAGGAKTAGATSPGRVWALRAGLAHRASARRTSQAARRAAASGLRRWPIYDNAVFLPLTLLRQSERSVNTWRLHAGNPSASQFVSTHRSSGPRSQRSFNPRGTVNL